MIRSGGIGAGRAAGTAAAVALVAVLSGCNSFFDQSEVGRFQATPLKLPILDELDVIEQPGTEMRNVTGVTRQDLIPDIAEYGIGPGDLVAALILDWPVQGQETPLQRRVNELGALRLPAPLGDVQVAGLTPSQAERAIAQALVERDVLRREPVVSVIVQEGRQRTYKILGEGGSGVGTGTFLIPEQEFRLLDALALARASLPPRIKTLYIYRPVQLVDPSVVETQAPPEDGEAGAPGPGDTTELIDTLMEGLEDRPGERGPAPERPAGEGEAPGQAAPGAMEGSLDTGRAGAWVNIDGRWVRVDGAATRPGADGGDGPGPVMTQRIIEVPFHRLAEGEMNYNIVIRSGDMIRVPAPDVGLVYLGGHIARRGAFTVPGERELTFKQLIHSAGGFGPLAIPERVDLTRRIGDNHEATIMLNARAIFDGRQPDFFIKPNDTINVGTTWWATPLAVFRNGFRASYGFGFVLDRNFSGDVFGQGRLFD